MGLGGTTCPPLASANLISLERIHISFQMSHSPIPLDAQGDGILGSRPSSLLTLHPREVSRSIVQYHKVRTFVDAIKESLAIQNPIITST